MKCFACDKAVSGDDLDKATGRYYCSDCFAPTIEEQFQQARKEFNESQYYIEPSFDGESQLCCSEPEFEGESLPLSLEDHGDEEPF